MKRIFILLIILVCGACEKENDEGKNEVFAQIIGVKYTLIDTWPINDVVWDMHKSFTFISKTEAFWQNFRYIYRDGKLISAGVAATQEYTYEINYPYIKFIDSDSGAESEYEFKGYSMFVNGTTTYSKDVE